MRVPINHSLPKEEVRRRLRERSHELADHIPGGVAQVETGWQGEDRMSLSVGAMGQTVAGTVEIEESRVVIDIQLPAALSFMEPIVAGAVRDRGQKLLAPH
jgi:hypothetical protein